MKVKIIIEAHAYADEERYDSIFEDANDESVIDPKIVIPLGKFRGHSLMFEYNESTRVNELISEIERAVWGYEDVSGLIEYTITMDSERFILDNYDAHFDLIMKYIDPLGSGEITMCLLVCIDAGTIYRDYPLRYYMNSKESGSHHEPHVHVEHFSHDYNASIRISDGMKIQGNLPQKYVKIATKLILSDQMYFYDCWNKYTDGLKVDINYHYGLINY